MKVIAVTGGIGSGKSTVTNEFARLGARTISADSVAHENMARGGCAYDEIVGAAELSERTAKSTGRGLRILSFRMIKNLRF